MKMPLPLRVDWQKKKAYLQVFHAVRQQRWLRDWHSNLNMQVKQ
jgi:hypothetical protein